MLLRAQADNLHWIAHELARLPFEFRIHTPAALRGEIVKISKRLERLARS